MDDLIKNYFDLLTKWNARMNLTAITSWDDFVRKNVRDVRELSPLIPNALRALDLGTGAGLPGILLAAIRPDCEVVLLDATKKKISFCEEAVRRLGLKNVSAIWGRAEDGGLINQLKPFDCVLSRATWKLKKFFEIGAPYLSSEGFFLALKGKGWRNELAELPPKLYIISERHEYRLDGGEERCILSARPPSHP